VKLVSLAAEYRRPLAVEWRPVEVGARSWESRMRASEVGLSVRMKFANFQFGAVGAARAERPAATHEVRPQLGRKS